MNVIYNISSTSLSTPLQEPSSWLLQAGQLTRCHEINDINTRLTCTYLGSAHYSSIVETEVTFHALEPCGLLFWKHTRFYINQSGFRWYWASLSRSFDENPQWSKYKLKIKGYDLIHLKPVKPVKPPKESTWLISMRFQRISFARWRHKGVTSSVLMYSSTC